MPPVPPPGSAPGDIICIIICDYVYNYRFAKRGHIQSYEIDSPELCFIVTQNSCTHLKMAIVAHYCKLMAYFNYEI